MANQRPFLRVIEGEGKPEPEPLSHISSNNRAAWTALAVVGTLVCAGVAWNASKSTSDEKINKYIESTQVHKNPNRITRQEFSEVAADYHRGPEKSDRMVGTFMLRGFQTVPKLMEAVSSLPAEDIDPSTAMPEQSVANFLSQTNTVGTSRILTSDPRLVTVWESQPAGLGGETVVFAEPVSASHQG
jgi:hypothetical protein